MLFDVVCGMEFSAANVGYQSSYDGGSYFFCSELCKDHFENDPEKYAGS